MKSAISRSLLVGIGFSLLNLSSIVWAHNPVANCKYITPERIQCKGGFSDGSDAPGVTLDVIGYDETILLPGKLSAESSIEFDKPKVEFYILFDAGPGHVVEIDQSDIQP